MPRRIQLAAMQRQDTEQAAADGVTATKAKKAPPAKARAGKVAAKKVAKKARR